MVARNVTIGQTVAASFQTPILFLIATDLTKMQVDTNVSESDIGGIKDGDQAYFTVDAFPNRTFQGKVSQVRQSPQNIQNVVTYDVVVSVDNASLALKPGMTAASRIVTDERKDVLRVPSQALRFLPAGVTTRTGGQRAGSSGQAGKAAAPSNQGAVYVLRDGKPVKVPVTVGLDDDSHAEIVKGDLKQGDRVIVTAQRGGTANNKPAAGPAPALLTCPQRPKLRSFPRKRESRASFEERIFALGPRFRGDERVKPNAALPWPNRSSSSSTSRAPIMSAASTCRHCATSASPSRPANSSPSWAIRARASRR